MVKELIPVPIESKAPILSDPDFETFCEHLLDEGINYNKLPPDQVTVLSTLMSYVLHRSLDGELSISIHFRDGLELLPGLDLQLARSKAFLGHLHIGLHLLAQELIAGKLRDVEMIYGLAHLPEQWGRKHGFTTRPYIPKDPELLKRHYESIYGKTDKNPDELPPLTFFSHRRETFIRKFYKEKLKDLNPTPVDN